MKSFGLLIHDTARLLKAEFERKARAHRLTLTQWRALGELSKSGGMSQAALAAAVEVSPMTVSDLLDRMESAGLVVRAPDPSDSRAKLVTLTDRARDLVVEMREIVDQVYARAFDGIDAAEREALIRVLGRISANLNGDGRQDDGAGAPEKMEGTVK